MGFGYVQQKSVTNNTGFTTISLTFTSPPTPGNLLICAITQNASTLVGLTVKDNNNNAYSVGIAFGAGMLVYYLLKAPSNVGQTITATWTSPTSSFFAMTIVEFSVTGGTAAYDNNASSSGTASGNNITLPQISAAQTGDLLFASASVATGIQNPALGATLSGWTGSGVTGNGDCTEYILSSVSALTNVAYTDSTANDSYNSVAVSFKFIPSAALQRGGADFSLGEIETSPEIGVFDG